MLRRLALFAFLDLEDYMLPCFTKKIIGVDCPGCGMQRSLVHLVRGEFGAAFDLYPAVFPLIFLFSFMLLDRFFTVKYAHAITSALAIFSVGTILTNYILKFI